MFLGSGVSASSVSSIDGASRPPTWEAFLKSALAEIRDTKQKRIVSKCLKEGDYLQACEFIKKFLDDEWVPFLKKSFQSPKFEPSDLHKAIHGLDASLVLTPNFDTIYDTFVSSETKGSTEVKSYTDVDIIRSVRQTERLVIKVHGTIDTSTEMVFTRSDYARVRSANSDFYKLIDSLMLTRTFLFIGAGLSDPDVQLLLEGYNYLYPTAPPHYMFQRASNSLTPHHVEQARSNYNLKILQYKNTSDHSDLLKQIKELSNEVSNRRLEMAAGQSW
ncbi:UNVERIFIED_CONTAM: SIR2 family protein [Actinomycetes bacterium ARC8]|nr:SIR2 family protein [Actinomycetes bacterium ARC8]